MDKFTGNLAEGLKRFALAGVGAVSLTIEKSKDVINRLAERGEITAAEGQAACDELQKKMSEQLAAFTAKLRADYENAGFEQLVTKCLALNAEQKAALIERITAQPGEQNSAEDEAVFSDPAYEETASEPCVCEKADAEEPTEKACACEPGASEPACCEEETAEEAPLAEDCACEKSAPESNA